LLLPLLLCCGLYYFLNQHRDLKDATRTLALTALLVLTGCTTIPKQRLSSILVGQPVSVLKARFGDAGRYGEKEAHYRWDREG